MFLVNFKEGVTKPTYAREILKVVNNNVMIVRPFRRDGPVPAISFPSYFVGKYADNKNQSQAIANKRKRSLYKDPALSHINTGLFFKSLSFTNPEQRLRNQYTFYLILIKQMTLKFIVSNTIVL